MSYNPITASILGHEIPGGVPLHRGEGEAAAAAPCGQREEC